MIDPTTTARALAAALGLPVDRIWLASRGIRPRRGQIPILGTLRALVAHERARAADRRAYRPRAVGQAEGPARGTITRELDALTRQAERAIRAARRSLPADLHPDLNAALTSCRHAFGEAAHLIRQEIENG